MHEKMTLDVAWEDEEAMAKKVDRVNKCVLFMYSITIQYLLTQATFQPSNQCKNLQFELYSRNFLHRTGGVSIDMWDYLLAWVVTLARDSQVIRFIVVPFLKKRGQEEHGIQDAIQMRLANEATLQL